MEVYPSCFIQSCIFKLWIAVTATTHGTAAATATVTAPYAVTATVTAPFGASTTVTVNAPSAASATATVASFSAATATASAANRNMNFLIIVLPIWKIGHLTTWLAAENKSDARCSVSVRLCLTI